MANNVFLVVDEMIRQLWYNQTIILVLVEYFSMLSICIYEFDCKIGMVIVLVV